MKNEDIVFGPTEDGGYYLVGMNEPHKEVFEKQSYGHASVMENTLARTEGSRITGRIYPGIK